jgi:hypothetical protein
VNVLKPPTLGAPDVLTLHPTSTNQVDITWANIPLRFAYSRRWYWKFWTLGNKAGYIFNERLEE